MAMSRKANAQVVHPQISQEGWGQVLLRSDPLPSRAKVGSVAKENLLQRASDIFNKQFSPDDYLLSHATIVCSVNTYTPKGFALGTIFEGGFRINRKYPDFRITQETQKNINDNKDAFSKPVLLKSYKTFAGAHNFCEHIQIEALSKGRIIDAVARTVGDSIYIDILIATDRKHEQLIEDILSGKMSTLSMGCNIEGSTCTKCGHWAPDETALCVHIKYEKGSIFYDEMGKPNIVAELCGGPDLEPTGGVTFIEASWVENPAFKGAVLRNILLPNEVPADKVEKVLKEAPRQWVETNLKTASKKADWSGPDGEGSDPEQSDSGQADDSSETDPTEEAPQESTDPFGDMSQDSEEKPMQEVEKDLEKHILDKVKKNVKKNMDDDKDPPGDTMAPNTAINRDASSYTAGLKRLVRTASSDAHLIEGLAQFNKQAGINIPVELYRIALKVGSFSRYSSHNEYIQMCRSASQKALRASEETLLLKIGQLLSNRGASVPPKGLKR